MKIARGTQKPGQTKEQTRLIAQGIQKGIDQYKKKHNEKTRDLDKKLKKVSTSGLMPDTSTDLSDIPQAVGHNKLPWILLALSWLAFAVYSVMTK